MRVVPLFPIVNHHHHHHDHDPFVGQGHNPNAESFDRHVYRATQPRKSTTVLSCYITFVYKYTHVFVSGQKKISAKCHRLSKYTSRFLSAFRSVKVILGSTKAVASDDAKSQTGNLPGSNECGYLRPSPGSEARGMSHSRRFGPNICRTLSAKPTSHGCVNL
jgi:hypothetical protein